MIWLLPILSPLLAALLISLPGVCRGLGRFLVPLAALPALLLALFAPADGGGFIAPAVLGLGLGFGEAGQIFLLFTSMLWLLAGVYALGYLAGDARRRRFDLFFLMTMTGNFGLVLARDVPGFYTFFALMTFSAFGLVIHPGTAEAKRAARIYLITAVGGEALLLGAIFLAVGAADSLRLEDMAPAVAASESRNLIMLLAFFGFGVKAGALPVHFWLPLAHPVAPVPASAVLSGAMIKAGLLGWLYFLPLGEGAFSGWGMFCLVAGVAAAFGGVAAGFVQTEPKTMLAYSSISQMGVMTMVLGMGLTGRVVWAAVLPVVLLYALNHALAKGALFFGAGMARATGRNGRGRWLVSAGLAVAALSVAGAPWTGGSMAKYAMKDVAAGMEEWMVPWLDWLLPLSSVATAVLLGRFMWLTWREMAAQEEGVAPAAMWGSWAVLLVAVVGAAGFATRWYALEIASSPVSAAGVWKDVWPVILGLVMLLVLGRIFHGKKVIKSLPPGDVVVGLERAAVLFRQGWKRLYLPGPSQWGIDLTEPLDRLAESERRSDFTNRIEERLRHRSVPGLLFMLLALALAAALILGTPVR